MLRIVHVDARQPNGSTVLPIRLVGQVRGQWVDELQRLCAEALAAGRVLDIDMAEVSFVDERGLRLFRELRGPRVRLTNCALFVAEQLKAIEQDV